MRFQERVQSCGDRLTPADRRLVRVVLDDPAAAALANSPQLARRAEVNPASVTRLSRKLGFDGFAGLQGALRAEFLGGEGSTARLAGALAEVGTEGALAAVVRQETEALAGLSRHVTEAQIEEAAALLAAARQVVLVAEGSAMGVALVLERKLCRLGRAARLARPEPRGLAEALMPLAPGDAVVVVALGRPPQHYAGLIAAVRAAGLTCIAIADQAGPLLDPPPDLLLAAPRGPRGARRSVVLPSAIVAALTLALARADAGAAAALGRYDALRAVLESSGGRR